MWISDFYGMPTEVFLVKSYREICYSRFSFEKQSSSDPKCKNRMLNVYEDVETLSKLVIPPKKTADHCKNAMFLAALLCVMEA